MTDSTRRSLLKGASVGGALAGLGGISAVSSWLTGMFHDEAAGVRFPAPAAEEIDEVSHVIARLSYGPRPGEYHRVSTMGVEAYVEEQLAPERIDDADSERKSRHFEALYAAPAAELFDYAPAELLDQLTRDKIYRALHSKRQLLELMVDFWSDHFNIDPSKGDCRWLKPMDDRDVIRQHAMGTFSELLHASAKSPAMLWYLDGRVNVKRSPEDKPNENYARELLELHTLGVDGGYTQQDVMEVARCLTGWRVRERNKYRFAVGKVEFSARLHDDGEKRVLGEIIPAGLGAGDLDRVLDLVAHHPSTARYIAGKLCQRFIGQETTEATIALVAKAFLDSRGDIRNTLRCLFSQPEFRQSRGRILKRPFHFVVSALRATAAQTNAGPALQDYLLRMGHAPFQYPTPDGYPYEEQPWLATLLWRWRFAAELAANGIEGTQIDREALARACSDKSQIIHHVLGRKATSEEAQSALNVGSPIALVLASPAFQFY